MSKISIIIPSELVKVLDRECKKQGVSRSELVDKILIDHLYIRCPTCGNVRDPKEEK